MTHKRPFLSIAHRGASGLAPENTLAALDAAMAHESDYSEIDVNLTRDGRLVLLHDDSIGRTTAARGKLRNLDFDDIAELDAGSWFDARFAGERIPTLTDAITRVRGKMKLNIEIKGRSGRSKVARKVVATIDEEDFIDNCMVTSFDKQAIVEVHQINPNITSGLITNSGIPSNLKNGLFDVFVCHYSIVDRELVTHIQNASKKILVWTVNQIAYMRRFIKMGVDGIITDRPDRLKQVRSSAWFSKNSPTDG